MLTRLKGLPASNFAKWASSSCISISTHRTISTTAATPQDTMAKEKLRGRAFYESLGSPKYIVAPMVDQSEFAWRMLTRSFLPPDLRTSILAYSPMLHAKLFANAPKYRDSHFTPLKKTSDSSSSDVFLDGNPRIDRPLFVQFCANEPDMLLEAAKLVQDHCDAVDLNLGCPQGIARKGNYGAFLQEDWDTIHKLINTLHTGLDIPVTAKMRILETKEKTLDYAKMILNAGASILTVHGRQREQKGHNTGLADWTVIRYLREQLPSETVIFANGNILQHDDLQKCLDETGADGVMSAEGNLYDPSLFAVPPPPGQEGREYWRGHDGKGGYRADAMLRRYLDIIHRYVLEQEPPVREPLFLPSDPQQATQEQLPPIETNADEDDDESRPAKRRKGNDEQAKTKHEKSSEANLSAMQPHCFHILRSLVGAHHDVRDALAKSRSGDIAAYENVLTLTEKAVKEGLLAYEANPAEFMDSDTSDGQDVPDPTKYSTEAVRRCKRPYWICQPRIRPLPLEAFEKGSMSLSKKEKAKLQAEAQDKEKAGLSKDGKVEVIDMPKPNGATTDATPSKVEQVEVPKEAAVCG